MAEPEALWKFFRRRKPSRAWRAAYTRQQEWMEVAKQERSRADRLAAALNEADSRSEEQGAFIGAKGLGDEFMAWALARHAEIDRLLDA